jgi:hypothetical protein
LDCQSILLDVLFWSSYRCWAAISDLSDWYYQCKSRDIKYAEDILKCTSDGTVFNEEGARQRSPLFWNMLVRPNGKLEIFAGINDGYNKGKVPISHSILFFNKVAARYGYSESRVTTSDIIKLLTQGVERSEQFKKIDGRLVLYEKKPSLHRLQYLMVIMKCCRNTVLKD